MPPAQWARDGRAQALSRRDEIPQLLDARRPDARHRVEVVDGAERPMARPVVEDALRRDGTDARQRIELLEGRAQADLAGAADPADSTGTPAAAPATRGTTICDPSASGAARLTAARSALGTAPPARATASATRLPSFSR